MSEAADEFSDLIEYELRTIYQEEEAESATPQKHGHLFNGDEQFPDEIVVRNDMGYIVEGEENETLAQEDVVGNIVVQEQHPLVTAVKETPSSPPHKRRKVTSASTHTGPRRFLLYDSLVAEIVDYDKEDDAPIVEFSMCGTDADDEKLPVECGICPDVMHRSKLNGHLQTHLKPGTKRFMCIYCDDDFFSRTYAAGHARRHMGIRPYVCEPCKLYYCTKQDLRVHQQRRHLAKEHVCEQCGKTFAQNTSLTNHRLLVHEKKRRFACEQCGKRFLRNYAMKEHVRNVHLGDRRQLDCPFCDQRFRDTHKLAQHRKDAHLNQSLFECRACGQGFTHIDYFDAHRRSLQCREKYKRGEEQQEVGCFIQPESKEAHVLPVVKLEQLPVDEEEEFTKKYLVAAEQQMQQVEYISQELLLQHVTEEHDVQHDIVLYEVENL